MVLSGSLLDYLCFYVMPNQNCSSFKRHISQIPGICESQYNFQLKTEGLLEFRNHLLTVPSKFLKDCSKSIYKGESLAKISNTKIIENSIESLIENKLFSELCFINQPLNSYPYQCTKLSKEQYSKSENFQKFSHIHNLLNKATASALLSVFQSRMVAASFESLRNENTIHEKLTKSTLRARLKPIHSSIDRKETKIKCLSDISNLEPPCNNKSLVTKYNSNLLQVESDNSSGNGSLESLSDVEHQLQSASCFDNHESQLETSSSFKRCENGTDTGYSSRCSTPTLCIGVNDSDKLESLNDQRALVDEEFEVLDPSSNNKSSNNLINSSRNGRQTFKKFQGSDCWQQRSKSCYYSHDTNYKNTMYSRFSKDKSYEGNTDNGRYHKKNAILLYTNYPSNGSNYSFQNRQNIHEDYSNFYPMGRYIPPKKKQSHSFPSNLLTHYNSYYQLNSQFDLRDSNAHFRRKLKSPAGCFTTKRCPQNNTNWRNDLLQDAKFPPNDLLKGGQWDNLSQQVWNMFEANQQLQVTFKAKMILKDRISNVIWNVLPISRLFVVGSSLSGFGTNASDVDMCLMVSPQDLDQRNDAQKVLRLLQGELNNCGFVEKMELITAKVPILKFRDSQTGIDIDLNCNNPVGIRNTHLLNAYSQLDWRVRPLVLIVKMWAQHHQINNAKDMTISSYSLVLMVLHYLQCGVQPRLLPCLHEAFPDKFTVNHVIFRIPVTEKMPHFISNNKQTLGELFLGFLDYFANKFTYIERAISIRTGRTLPSQECRYVRTRKNDSRTWRFLCIEEPFDFTNTARSVYDEVVFEKVKTVFKDSCCLLKETGDLSLLFKWR